MQFFRIVDPTTLNRQGPDVGDSYRSAIFYTSDDQKEQAEAMIKQLTDEHKYDKPIVTEVTAATEFYAAEDYHQKFAERTGRGMCHVDYAPVK
jgi:peptide-methionine (S)-S-oxide reductase